MKALVTGAGGFCGSHLVRYLETQGVEVHTLGSREAPGARHHWVPDITEGQALKSVVHAVEPDYIFHLAGIASAADPALFYRVNTEYAVALLSALGRTLADNCTILFVGTAAEYGMISSDQVPVREDTVPRPFSHYGISKLAQSFEGLAAVAQGKRIVIARPFNVIGPGMPDHLSVQSFAKQVAQIKTGAMPPRIEVGNLSSIRDFIDIRDLVKIYWDLVREPSACGEIVNICSGKGTQMERIVSTLIALSGVPIEIRVDPSRLKPVDVPVHVGSNSKLHDLLGYVPETNMEESLTTILNNLIKTS